MRTGESAGTINTEITAGNQAISKGMGNIRVTAILAVEVGAIEP